jgi:hypothetical protein
MSKGLTAGTVLPDFELPDDTGTKHKLSTLQGDNALVLQLGRGEHCPRERQHHKELLKLQELLPVAFTTLVTVLPNDLHDTNKMGLVIDKVYCGYWFWGRPSAYQLWEDLQDLFRRTKPDFDPTTPEARAAWQAA